VASLQTVKLTTALTSRGLCLRTSTTSVLSLLALPPTVNPPLRFLFPNHCSALDRNSFPLALACSSVLHWAE
jgi:hypothetical protein